MKPHDRAELLLRKRPDNLHAFLRVILNVWPYTEGTWK